MALYGHPEAGALWDKHLSAHLTALGWTKMADAPGTWRHEATGGLLIVYVDDLLMIAARASEAELWRAIGQRITFKEPAAAIGRYLGANHTLTTSGDHTTMQVNMVAFVRNACAEYRKELGLSHLPEVHAPFQGELACDTSDPAGEMSGSCASHLMRLLFAARMARPDLIVAITRLASHVSRWKCLHD
eukprot:9854431-Heterocapsa_arctica.AAC.1